MKTIIDKYIVHVCVIGIISLYVLYIYTTDSAERRCMDGAEKARGYLTTEMYEWCKEVF